MQMQGHLQEENQCCEVDSQTVKGGGAALKAKLNQVNWNDYNYL